MKQSTLESSNNKALKLNLKISKLDQKISILREKRKKAELKYQTKILKLLKKHKIFDKDMTEIESFLKNVQQQSTSKNQ